MTIAGHTFTETPEGKRVCACGKSWIDVAPASRSDLGTAGWAHTGTLSESELYEIEQERERIWLRGVGRA
jgi:hypothetical protein